MAEFLILLMINQVILAEPQVTGEGGLQFNPSLATLIQDDRNSRTKFVSSLHIIRCITKLRNRIHTDVYQFKQCEGRLNGLSNDSVHRRSTDTEKTTTPFGILK